MVPTMGRMETSPAGGKIGLAGLPTEEVVKALEAWARARGWRGTDPYDGLNARRLIGPLRRTVMGRRLGIQLVKRSPIDVRPLLAVPPARSAVTLAHAV